MVFIAAGLPESLTLLARPYKRAFKDAKTPLGDKVSMLNHIYPHKARRKIEVIICKITRLTAHFMCGLMSDLMICTCL